MPSQIIATVLAALIIMSASLIGVVTVTKRLGRFTERNLKHLVSFAAGVFIIVSYNLAKEAFELSANTSTVIMAFLGGIVAAHLIAKLLPESHHHHGEEIGKERHDRAGAKRIMLSDAFHNIADGFLLAPAFIYDIQLGILGSGSGYTRRPRRSLSSSYR